MTLITTVLMIMLVQTFHEWP